MSTTIDKPTLEKSGISVTPFTNALDAGSNSNNSTSSTKETPRKKKPKSFLSVFPTWVSNPLKSPASWKLLARCWLASWAAFILLLPQNSLNVLGNTAFFTVLTSLFLPPNLPIQMFIFIISTLVFGILGGWAIGCAAMKAALDARNQVLLKTTLEQVESSAAGLADPELLFTARIFQGFFLDVRSSVVFGVFLFFGVFFFGYVRAYAPKLTMLSIFGTIALDIMCSYGPLFPFAEYTILTSLLTSVGCYVAIACVITIFVFPETMNHSCMSATANQLGAIKALVGMQDLVLQSNPEDLRQDGTLLAELAGARAGILAAQKALMAKSGFINLEFSLGRWNGDDVRGLEEPLLALVTRSSALQGFARLVGEPRSQAFEPSKIPPEKMKTKGSSSRPSTATTTNSTTSTLPHPPDQHLLQQIYMRYEALESQHNLGLEYLLPVLRECTKELREACIEGLGTAQGAIDSINQHRWRVDKTKQEECEKKFLEAQERLKIALQEFKETKRHMLIEPYMPLLKSNLTKDERRTLPLRSLYLSYVFATNLIVVADVLLAFLSKVADTNKKRRKNRLWAPKGLRAIAKIWGERPHEDEPSLGEDRSDKTDADVKDELYRRDPDSRPPTNLVQKVMDGIHKVWRWTKTAEAVFCFKYSFITVALWIPAVVSNSAAFYYDQKGLWALIMAQTTLNIYAADQIFNLFIRMTGTFAGLCIGLATWYIGSGSGPGNPYGIAASAAVFVIPVMFVRLNAPPQYQGGSILFCVTWALIVGYSWIDSHLVIVGNPGLGWPVAWKRFVLVVIGSAASFIMMMLPPVSSRKVVRLRNASSIGGMSEIYGFLISTWIGTQARQKKTKGASEGPTPAIWMKDFRVKLLSVADQVLATKQMTAMAKWEGSVRGKWPAEEYEKLIEVEGEMIGGLAQLGGALGHLEDTWRLTFLHSTNVLHPNFISDVMSMYSLVSHALRNAEPMHQVLPQTLLERLFYHRHTSFLSPNSNKKDMVDIEEMASIDYMFYCTGLVAVYHILQSLDEMHRITKSLVGEVPLKGFGDWKEEYNRAHIHSTLASNV